jgi:hypothetical protein
MAVVLNEYGGTIGVCPNETQFLYFMCLQTGHSSVLVNDSSYVFHPRIVTRLSPF